MMSNILASLIGAVIYGSLPALARQITSWCGRRLPSEIANEVVREWLAEQAQMENLCQLIHACTLVVGVLDIRAMVVGESAPMIAEASKAVWFFRATKAALWAAEGWVLHRKRAGLWLGLGSQAIGAVLVFVFSRTLSHPMLQALGFVALAVWGYGAPTLILKRARVRLPDPVAAVVADQEAAEMPPPASETTPPRKSASRKGPPPEPGVC